MSRRRPDKPKFWIVAGPNGSGKSSIYTDTDIDDFGGSVWIINPDLLTARIREIERMKPRAANIAAVKGGHHVPTTKIRQRRERSLQQLPWFLKNADLAWIFDNSGAKPAQIAQKVGNTIIVDPAALPEIKEAVRRIKSMK